MSAYTDALKRKLNKGHQAGPKHFGSMKKKRFGLTKVNPDPRPPNEPKGDRGQQSNVGKGKGKGRRTMESAGFPTGGQGPGQGTGGAPAYANPIDPRDAEYWRNLTVLKQDRNLSLQNVDLEQTYADTAHQEALRRLAFQEPEDIRQTREGANRGGRFYSSATTEDIGKIGTQYFEQRSGAARDKQREDSLRKLTRDMIENGYTAEEAALYAEAVDRQAGLEVDRPAPYEDPIEAAIAALEKKKPKKKKPQGGKQQGGGKGGGQQGGQGNKGGKGKNKGKNR